MTLENLNIESFRDGVLITADIDDLTLTNVDIADVILGVATDAGYSNTLRTIDGLRIVGGSVSRAHVGIDAEKLGSPPGGGVGDVVNLVIDGVHFEDITAKGIYFEGLSNALIQGVTMDHVGYFGGEPTFGAFAGAGIELNLKKGEFTDIVITDFTMTNVGQSLRFGAPHDNAAAISVKSRGDNGDNPAYNPVIFTGPVTISNGSINGTSTGIRAGEQGRSLLGPKVVIDNVSVLGAVHDAQNGDVENLTSAMMTVSLTNEADTLVVSQQSFGPITINGGADGDNITGAGGAEVLNGDGGSDFLTGLGGADRLDGGTGADVMSGGTGDDTYVVDDPSDQVIELENEGTDEVEASISYTLGANVERLILSEGQAIDGTGNGLANRITGNAMANRIAGLGGADVLNGAGGIDTVTYAASLAAVVVSLTTGLGSGGDAEGDELSGFENIEGSAHSDTLTGDGAANWIDGGAGLDALAGLGGDDTYLVDQETDSVVEIAAGGVDTVISSAFLFTLAAEVENLTLATGAGDTFGVGNELSNILLGNAGINTLVGNDGADTLDGGQGADYLLGGAGNDLYKVDNTFDLVDEGGAFPAYAGLGTDFDTIATTAEWFWDVYSVGERLQLEEGAAGSEGAGTTIVGSIFGNEMIGNSGTNIMFGRGGADTYRAGDGVDWISLDLLGVTEENSYVGVDGANTIIVDKRITGGFSYDIIFEFEVGKDKIDVSDYGYATASEVILRGLDDGAGNSYYALGDGLDYVFLVGVTKSEIQLADFVA